LTLQDANDRLQHERDEAVRAAATTQVRVHELETTLQTYREQVTGLTTRTEQLAAEVNVLQQGLRNQESQYAELRSAYEQAGQQSARPLDDAELFDEVLGDEDLLRDLTRRDSAW
jgi:chromosome segregation ATPase